MVTKLTYEVTYGDPVFKIAANAEDTESGIHFTSDNENVTTVSADGTVTIKMQEPLRLQFPWMKARISLQFPKK